MHKRLCAALATVVVASLGLAPQLAAASGNVPSGPPANTPYGQCVVVTPPTIPPTYNCQIVGYTAPSASGGTAAVVVSSTLVTGGSDQPSTPQGSATASDHYLNDTPAFR